MYLEANDVKIEEVMEELEKRKNDYDDDIIFLLKFYVENR